MCRYEAGLNCSSRSRRSDLGDGSGNRKGGLPILVGGGEGEKRLRLSADPQDQAASFRGGLDGARIDEDWQIGQWVKDAEAEAPRPLLGRDAGGEPAADVVREQHVTGSLRRGPRMV